MKKEIKDQIRMYRGIIKYYEDAIEELEQRHSKTRKRRIIATNRHIKPARMARLMGVSRQYVYQLRKQWDNGEFDAIGRRRKNTGGSAEDAEVL